MKAWLISKLNGMTAYSIEKRPMTISASCASESVAPVAHCHFLNRRVI